MHAKLLQSYPTFCDPMDYSLPGFSVHGIPQAIKLEWVAISYSGDLPDPGIKPTSLMSPALAGMFFTSSATCEASVEKQTRFTKRHVPDCSQQRCSQSPEMPVSGRKEKCIAMCSHHGICHSKENECYTTSCHTMCEFHKDDVKDRSQKQEFCTV